jgi:aerobic carbon-monoxide dehydrogenase large subunit
MRVEGAVRPHQTIRNERQASYLIESIIEVAARELKIDSVELRRRNLIKPEAMPYRAALGPIYDCGDFPGNMECE